MGFNSLISLLLIAVCSILSLTNSVVALTQPQLVDSYKPLGPPKVGYYARTCPDAERIVRQTVYKAVSLNLGIAAGLIRLHFHDCFVRGCDASVLLDTKPGGPASEKDSPPNLSLRGYEVINIAKAQLEGVCRGMVSCADILAFAARDSVYKVGNINYNVTSGRRDGLVSLANDVLQNLPAPFFNASTVIASFASKGLSTDEMVVLSGAHSIGIAHCTSFANRIYPTPDPTMDPSFAAYLIKICPPSTANGIGPDPIVSLDSLTPYALDNKYYIDLLARRGLLTSDQTLYTTPSTSTLVSYYAKNPAAWAQKFAAAMIHMGNLDLLQYPQGEIRRNCHVKN